MKHSFSIHLPESTPERDELGAKFIANLGTFRSVESKNFNPQTGTVEFTVKNTVMVDFIIGSMRKDLDKLELTNVPIEQQNKPE